MVICTCNREKKITLPTKGGWRQASSLCLKIPGRRVFLRSQTEKNIKWGGGRIRLVPRKWKFFFNLKWFWGSIMLKEDAASARKCWRQDWSLSSLNVQVFTCWSLGLWALIMNKRVGREGWHISRHLESGLPLCPLAYIFFSQYNSGSHPSHWHQDEKWWGPLLTISHDIFMTSGCGREGIMCIGTVIFSTVSSADSITFKWSLSSRPDSESGEVHIFCWGMRSASTSMGNECRDDQAGPKVHETHLST